MKLKKSLTPVSIALQGLIAVPAVFAGYTVNNNYVSNNPPYSTAGSDSGNGSTQAQYSGTSRTINYFTVGWATYTGTGFWETEQDNSVMGTLVVASWTWNPGCYSDCFSMVWPDIGGIGKFYPTQPTSGTGAWNEIK